MKNKNILSVLCLAAALALLFGCSDNKSPEAQLVLESRQEKDAVISAGLILDNDASDKNAKNETDSSSEEENSTEPDTFQESTETSVTSVSETTSTETVTQTTPDPAAPFIDYDADIDPEKPMICLTFDDGPSEQTSLILDCLEEYDSHATFFVVGSNINEYNGQIMKRAVELGCEIGNHTYNHQNLAQADTELMDSEIQKTDDLVFQYTGRYTYWLRPPYGAFDDLSRTHIKKPQAYWSIDTLDWSTRSSHSTVSTILSMVEDGDIILMHDLYKETTEAALDVIPELVNRGYQLVTVSELAYYRDFEIENGIILFNLYPDQYDFYPALESSNDSTDSSQTDGTSTTETTESTTVE
ncbi:MAG: polysaccharide deacetylase family protein [Oscillospiraceae bacterium]|nr:polysaccharide deacetylase family protein [Oscillospiraceae bacterium]